VLYPLIINNKTYNDGHQNDTSEQQLLQRLECVGHSLAYVTHFEFLRDVWIIRTQRAAAASRHATNLATHLPKITKDTTYHQTHSKIKREKNP
jgi:hypothetical protein